MVPVLKGSASFFVPRCFCYCVGAVASLVTLL